MPQYIPNSFQTPNAFVYARKIGDGLMPLLSGAEYKVLIFCTRQVLGWVSNIEDLKAPIPIEHIEKGCGLARQTVVNALRTLANANVIVLDEDGRGEFRRGGSVRSLNLGQHGDYNWQFLEKRAKVRRRKAQERTRPARAARQGVENPVDRPPQPLETPERPAPIVDKWLEIVDNSSQIVDKSVEKRNTSTGRTPSESLSDRLDEVCGTDFLSLYKPMLLNPDMRDDYEEGAAVEIVENVVAEIATHEWHLKRTRAERWGREAGQIFRKSQMSVMEFYLYIGCAWDAWRQCKAKVRKPGPWFMAVLRNIIREALGTHSPL